MAELNLQEYREFLKTALDMAWGCEQEYAEKFRKNDPEGKGYYEADLCDINIENLIASGKERELMDFLKNNEYELTKILCIIFWVGRDSSLEGDDGTYNYSDIRNSFDRTGWSTNKEGQIDYLVGKVNLYTYLNRGLEKLNIIL